jgi:hypothetical protein
MIPAFTTQLLRGFGGVPGAVTQPLQPEFENHVRNHQTMFPDMGLPLVIGFEDNALLQPFTLKPKSPISRRFCFILLTAIPRSEIECDSYDRVDTASPGHVTVLVNFQFCISA